MPWWLYILAAAAVVFVVGMAWLLWELESAEEEYLRRWR